MFKWINESSVLARFLERLSATMAKQRGLPIVIGVLLVAVGFVVQVINIIDPSKTLELVWAITLHGGLLLALIGILLVEPLGQ